VADGALAVPDDLAGQGHDTAWADEFATWMNNRDGAGRTAFDNLTFSMSGSHGFTDPRMILTGTPRALKSVRDLFLRPDTVHTVMSLLDNRGNLPESLVASLLREYGGTRLGDQEIYGRLIDADGAYYQRSWFAGRILDECPPLTAEARFWDLAHAAPSAKNPDPDFTVGNKGGYDPTGDRYVWSDMRRMRGTTADREAFMCDVAQPDGPHIIQYLEQSPGAGAEIIDPGTQPALVEQAEQDMQRVAVDDARKRDSERAKLEADAFARQEAVQAEMDGDATRLAPVSEQIRMLADAMAAMNKPRRKIPVRDENGFIVEVREVPEEDMING
jgi:hypothetical protein